MTAEPLETRTLFAWIGATTGTTNDPTHQYDNAANWAGGVIDDSFAGVTLSGNTTLYLAGNRTTAATGLNLNYGGAFDLIIKSSSATIRTLTLAGDVGGTFGGSNVTIGDATNGISVALGVASRTLTSGSGQTLTLVNIVSGVGGFIKSGAGALTLTGTNTYTGGTTLAVGQINLNNAKAIGTGTFTINGGSIDNTTAAAITLSNNNAQVWGGDFAFVGTQSLNMGTGAVTLAANRAITTGGGLLTEGGIISGAGSLTKNGVGALTLVGLNTFAGGTTLNAGQLNINSTKAVGTGTLAIAGGVIDNTSGAAVTLSTNNTQTWDANVTFNGSAALSLGTGAITLTGNRTATVNGSALTLAGIIGDGGNNFSLAKSGTGTLTLGGANTFAGGVRLNAGQLNINHASALGAGTFEIDGGTIDNTSAATITLSTNNAQIWGGDFTFVGTRALSLGTGNVSLQGARIITASASTITIGGVIDDGASAFDLTKAGVGILAIIGSNTFDGGVTINAGTLSFGTGGLGSGAVTFSSSSTLQWATGNTQDISANIADISGGVVATIDTVANIVIFASSIGGAGAITKIGTGTLTLATANTHSGGTTLTAGTLNLNDAGALGTGTFTINGGTINNSSAAAIVINTNNAQSWAANFTFTGTRNLDLGTGAVTLTGNRVVTVGANTLIVNGAIVGAFSLAKAGSGAMTLPVANTYTGGTTLTLGTLNINHASAIPAGLLTLNGGTLNNTSGAAITLANNNAVTLGGTIAFGGTNVLNLGTGAITLTGNRSISVTAGTTTLSGVIGGAFSLTKAGTGALALVNANTYTGGTILTAGTLAINNANAIGSGTFTISGGTIDNTSGAAITLATNNAQIWGGTVTIANGNLINLGTGNVTLTGNRSVSVTAGIFGVAGVVSGAFSLTKAGAGTLTLSNANTYSAGTTMSAGVLNLNNANAIGTGTLTLTAGTLDNITGTALTLANNQTWGGNFTVGGTNNLAVTGNVTLTGNRSVTTTAGMLSLNGTVAGAFSLTKAGAGTLVLAGANTYSNGTVLSAGELDINHAAAIGTGTLTISGGTINNTSGNAITLGSNNAQSWGGNFSFGGANDLIFGTGTITLTGNRVITTAAGTLTLRGAIAGAFGLTKSGVGTLLVTGASTFSAGLTVNNGTFLANNTSGSGTGSGAVAVNSGATLAGTGRASGAVTINNGGTLSPGNNSTAIFSTGNLILNAGATLTLTLDGDIAGTEYDAVNVTGTVNLGSGTLTLSGSRDDHSGANLTIISNDAADAVTGAFVGKPQGSITTSNGVNYSTSYLGGTGNDVVLSANLATTSTAIVAGSASTIFGEAVTFTATVTSGSTGTPTGVATFLDGGVTLGSASLDAFGVASFTTTLLDVGSRIITAVYGGDGEFATSTSSSTSHNVDQASSAIDLQSSLSSAVKGESLTFTVIVTAVAPGAGVASGDVTFMDGALVLNVGTLDGTGVATFVTDALDAGSHAITAIYAGDANFLASTSADLTQTVQQGTTSVTLGSSLSPSVVGQTVTLTANLTVDAPAVGTPTGLVTFKDGSSVLGSVAVDGAGVATFNVASLGAGTHSLTAVYSGDLNFEAGISGASTQAVDQGLTTTSIFSTVNGSTYGQSTSLIATVVVATPAAGTPTGSVTFYDGATVLGVGTLNGSGQASLNISLLSTGTHQITADYAGDADFSVSVSSEITQTVAAAGTLTSLTTSPTTSVFGQSFTMTATLATVAPGSGLPGGTITFKDGAAILGVVSIDSAGMASLNIASLSVGSHALSAEYSGGVHFLSSTSATHTQIVGQSAATLSLSSNDQASVFGQTITFTAHIAAAAPGAGAPTGVIEFYDGASLLGTGTIDGSGNATLSTSMLDVDDHAITAVYGGDVHFSASASTVFMEAVSNAATTTSLSATSPTVLGESVTLTATVTVNSPGSGIAGGLVTFKDGSDVLGNAVLNASGVAIFSTSSLDVGTHTLTAIYAGNVSFATSVSSSASHVVHQAATATSIAASTHPSTSGQTVVFTATVATIGPGAGTAGGTVTFKNGSTVLGTAAVNSSGVASLSVSNLAVGNHSIVAAYSGNAQFTGSLSAALTQSVQQAATTVTLQSSIDSTVVGQPTTFNAHVNVETPGSGTPSGQIAFHDGPTLLGIATLDESGDASLSISTLAVGTHSISATYSGDASLIGSISATTFQIVDPAETISSVVSSQTSSAFGAGVTLTATIVTIAPGSGLPGGTVTFREGSIVLGSGVLDAFGVAVLTVPDFEVGDHLITAEYSGGASFVGSVSSTLLQHVGQAATGSSIGLSVDPSAFGESVRITATITAPLASGMPTGTVEFTDGATLLGTALIDSAGVAFIDVADFTVGDHTITVSYSGDAHHAASSAISPFEVHAAGTLTTIASSGASASFGEAIELTATVIVVSPGVGSVAGIVWFYDGTTLIGTSAVDSAGTATLTVLGISGGEHFFTAAYQGETTHTPSISADLLIEVRRAQTLGEVTLSRPTVEAGQEVTLTMTVVAGIDGPLTGSISFFDGETMLGSVALDSSGQGTWTGILRSGSHSITATYSGDENFAPTRSPVALLLVNEKPATPEPTPEPTPGPTPEPMTPEEPEEPSVPEEPSAPEEPAAPEAPTPPSGAEIPPTLSAAPLTSASGVRASDEARETVADAIFDESKSSAIRVTRTTMTLARVKENKTSTSRSPTSGATLIPAVTLAAAPGADTTAEPADIKLASKKVEHEKPATEPTPPAGEAPANETPANETPPQKPSVPNHADEPSDPAEPALIPEIDAAASKLSAGRTVDGDTVSPSRMPRSAAMPGILAVICLFFTSGHARRARSQRPAKARVDRRAAEFR